MSKSAHTPGAMRAVQAIAEMCGEDGQWSKAFQAQMAALIDNETAAPEMLEALEIIERHAATANPASIRATALAAIAKARGEA